MVHKYAEFYADFKSGEKVGEIISPKKIRPKVFYDHESKWKNCKFPLLFC
jgi:hypothetical protein